MYARTHTYIDRCIYSFIGTYIGAYTNLLIHTLFINTYTHTQIYIYIYTNIYLLYVITRANVHQHALGVFKAARYIEVLDN